MLSFELKKPDPGKAPDELEIHLDQAGLEALYDLMAVLMRYDIDMKGLRNLVTSRNKAWMTNPQAYWYAKIFGGKLTRTSKAAQSKKKAAKRQIK